MSQRCLIHTETRLSFHFSLSLIGVCSALIYSNTHSFIHFYSFFYFFSMTYTPISTGFSHQLIPEFQHLFFFFFLQNAIQSHHYYSLIKILIGGGKKEHPSHSRSINKMDYPCLAESNGCVKKAPAINV